VEEGDGDKALLEAVQGATAERDLQLLKQYVDIHCYVKAHILFMFLDTEREMDAVMRNTAAEEGGAGPKLLFCVNDTDASFFAGVQGVTDKESEAGNGSYVYKWLHSQPILSGAGGIFAAFSCATIGAAEKVNAQAEAERGNLEFRTIVKDEVALAFEGEGAPLGAQNVSARIRAEVEKLLPVYRLDAAYTACGDYIADMWPESAQDVIDSLEGRVAFSRAMWEAHGLAHTLLPVRIEAEAASGAQGASGGAQSASGESKPAAKYALDNPNAGAQTYYTLDGSDPMGADGAIAGTPYASGSLPLPVGAKVRARAYAAGNWGPLSEMVVP